MRTTRSPAGAGTRSRPEGAGSLPPNRPSRRPGELGLLWAEAAAMAASTAAIAANALSAPRCKRVMADDLAETAGISPYEFLRPNCDCGKVKGQRSGGRESP